MNISVENDDINCDYYYMNSSNESFIKNHNSIDYTKKIDEISTNRYLREYNGLTDGLDIDYMLPEYAPN